MRWSPSTVGALPGMRPNRSSGRDLLETAPGEEHLHVVGAFAVVGDVETLAFLLEGGTQTDDDID